MSLSPTCWTQITYPSYSIHWDISAPVVTNRGWERFEILASDLIPPGIQIDNVEAEKTASAFTSSIVSTCRLSTCKFTLSDLINLLSGLDHFLQRRRMLLKLWHGIRDPTCKTVLNWVTKTIQRMIRRNATERWEKIAFLRSHLIQSGLLRNHL